MLLNADILYYWIHKEYPNSFLIRSKKSKIHVKFPVFFTTSEKLQERLVIIKPAQCVQIVHNIDCIFLCVGCSKEHIRDKHNEYIILTDDLPLEHVFNSILNIFERFSTLESSLEQATNISLSYSAIIKCFDDFLNDPLALLDFNYHYVGYSKKLAYENGYEKKYVDSYNYLPREVIDEVMIISEWKKLEHCKTIYQYDVPEHNQYKNVFYKGKFIARLMLPYTSDLITDAYYSQILTIASKYIEGLYNNLGTFRHHKPANERLTCMLSEMLKGMTPDKDVFFEQLQHISYSNGDIFYLIQLKSNFPEDKRMINNALSTHLESMYPCSICILSEDKFLILLNFTKYTLITGKDFLHELVIFLRENVLLASFSRQFSDIFSLRTAFRQTEIALDLGKQYNPTHWYFKFDDYAFRYLLLHGNYEFLPEQIGSPIVNTLLEYDRINNTELNHTLYIYVQKRYNAVAAAKELCIVRSSFLKRMARIEALTHLNLDNFQQRIYLELTYAMLYMLKL